MREDLLIVGAGPAAFSACTHLRGGGYDGRIKIIGDEPSVPYERPPLSKTYLSGELSVEALEFRPEAWYRDNSIELLADCRVLSIDAERREATISVGHAVPFSNLLIATGAAPRKLNALHSTRTAYLRTVEDADRISPYLASGARIVVVGGGFIGAEVAATARRMGADVTIIEAMDAPMKRALGADISRIYTEIHCDEGVRFELSSTIESVCEGRDGLKLTTSRGTTLDCDLLVVGVGAVPNTGFLGSSGIALDNGVLVDEYAQTNVSGITAAGDVANHWHPLFNCRMRVEHHDNALQQAIAAVNHLIGVRESYNTVHWIWSDQYDYNLQLAGRSDECDQVVIRGSVGDRKFSVFYLRDSELKAVLGINSGRDVVAGRRIISRRGRVCPEKLADCDSPVKHAILADAGR